MTLQNPARNNWVCDTCHVTETAMDTLFWPMRLGSLAPGSCAPLNHPGRPGRPGRPGANGERHQPVKWHPAGIGPPAGLDSGTTPRFPPRRTP